MLSDAMNAGVNHGGLQNRTEIRVLICYVLSNSKHPVPLDILKERLHFEGIANYFETAYAISDLLENNNILVVDDSETPMCYKITEDGRKIVAALGNDVPLSVRERAMEICEEILARLINERQHNVQINTVENGVYVTCSVMEKETELLTVKILVPDQESAKNVKENFLKNPMEVLVSATSTLTGSKL